MDDSDQDFSLLCSRLLKRVRRKGGESEDEKKTLVKDEGGEEDLGARKQSRGRAPCKRKREKKGGLPGKSTDRGPPIGLINGGPEAAVVGGGEEQKVRVQFLFFCTLCRYQDIGFLCSLIPVGLQDPCLYTFSPFPSWVSSGFSLFSSHVPNVFQQVWFLKMTVYRY